MTINLPANWVYYEDNYTTTNGAKVDLLWLGDQADQGSRMTKQGYVLRSTASGIFGLPRSVTTRLEPVDMANYMVHQMLRTSIAGKVISAKVVDRSGEKVYSVEWSHNATQFSDKLEFIALEEFIFRGDVVYWVHGEYASFRGASVRDTIVRVVQSFTANR